MDILKESFMISLLLLIICFWCGGGVDEPATKKESQPEIFTFRPLNNTWRNFSVSSPEFHEVASRTYSKVLPSTWMMANQTQNFTFPADAEQHFWEVWNATAPFRKQKPHSYSGYKGPWIENHIIAHFSHHPLSYFGGLIPIYVQWVDNQVEHNQSFVLIRQVLKEVLRPEVLYFTVSQSAIGIAEISLDHPNLLVFSAGGFGHVAIPLIKGELKAAPPPPKSYSTEIGFYGAIDKRGTRNDMIAIFKNETRQHRLSFRAGSSKRWMNEMAATKFNLAPRGFGRTSFRFAEIIQLGRIPVFLYNDLPWIPYEGSSIRIKDYGLIGRLAENMTINTIPSVVQEIKTMSRDVFENKLQMVKELRSLFTYPGVLRENELFLQDPFGPRGGHLTCGTFPHTTGCCGR